MSSSEDSFYNLVDTINKLAYFLNRWVGRVFMAAFITNVT